MFGAKKEVVVEPPPKKKMAKVTAKGTVGVADIKAMSGKDLEYSGTMTAVKTLDSGIKIKATVKSKALQTSSLAGCTVGLEMPKLVSATYALDTKATKVVYTNSATLQGKSVKTKVTFNTKGNAFAAESTVDLADDISATAKYDFKKSSAVASLSFPIGQFTVEPEYDLSDKSLSCEVSTEQTIKGVPVTATYEPFSKAVGVELDFSPATVELSYTVGESPIGLSVVASKTFDI